MDIDPQSLYLHTLDTTVHCSLPQGVYQTVYNGNVAMAREVCVLESSSFTNLLLIDLNVLG